MVTKKVLKMDLRLLCHYTTCFKIDYSFLHFQCFPPMASSVSYRERCIWETSD